MLPLAVRRLELVVLMLKEKRKTEKEREIHVQSKRNLGTEESGRGGEVGV